MIDGNRGARHASALCVLAEVAVVFRIVLEPKKSLCLSWKMNIRKSQRSSGSTCKTFDDRLTWLMTNSENFKGNQETSSPGGVTFFAVRRQTKWQGGLLTIM